MHLLHGPNETILNETGQYETGPNETTPNKTGQKEKGPKERLILSFASGFICILTFLTGMYFGFV